MVFAETVDVNILDDDHLVVALVEESVGDVLDVGLVALGKKQKSIRVTRRRVQEPFTVGILADTLEEGAHSTAHLFEPLPGSFVVVFSTLSGSATCAGSASTALIG